MELEIENTKKGKDLKEAYLGKINKKDQPIRIFTVGQEILDEKQLFAYGIQSKYVVISMFVK